MSRKITLFILSFCCYTAPVLAQFNPKSQATRIEPVSVDTLIKATPPAPELKFELYSDAYDQYLRKLRAKQRNTYSIQPALSFSQGTFTNWQKGGDNSFAGMAALTIQHDYTAPIFSVRSIFDAKFGLMRLDNETRKNMDYFNLSSTQSWNISARWKLSTNQTFRSQFTNSYDYSKTPKLWKSTFMSPGIVELSGGFTYQSANKKLNVLLSPLAGKMTIVLNDSLALNGGFGIDPKTENPNFKAQIGLMGRLTYESDFFKGKVNYKTKAETFWNYQNDPTFFWENTLGLKISNAFGVNIFTQFLYNDQIATPKAQEVTDPTQKIERWRYIQFYQTVGFTLSYKFASKPRKPIEESTITKSRLKYKK